MAGVAARGRTTGRRDEVLLVAGSAVASLGYGLYTTGSLLFATRVVGLPVERLGLALSVAGATALLAGPLVGRLCDRYGARAVCVSVGLLQSALLAALVPVRSPLALVVVLALLGAAENGGAVARQALVADVAGPAGRVRLAAWLRSAFTGGLTLGLAAAGVALAADPRRAAPAVVLVTAATCLAATALTLPVRVRAASPGAHPVLLRTALRDLPYAAVAVLTGLAGVVETAGTLGLPLWVLTRTAVPRPFASWLLAGSTVLVVALQVPVARRVRDVARARRALGAGCVVAVVAAGLVGSSGGRGVAAALVLLAGAGALLALASVLVAAAGWALRYDLAPEGAQGVYGGVFATAGGLRTLVGPAVVTLAVGDVALGGALLAGGLVALAALAGPVVRWCARTRPATVDDDAALGVPV
jgi:hypothetical protein